jgi:hypothetical protein
VNATDRIIAALTPGTIFNKGEKIYRSLDSLSKFAGLSEDETITLLSGDMVDLVTCKPAKDQQTILIGLIAIVDAALPAPAEEQEEGNDPPVHLPLPAPLAALGEDGIAMAAIAGGAEPLAVDAEFGEDQEAELPEVAQGHAGEAVE